MLRARSSRIVVAVWVVVVGALIGLSVLFPTYGEICKEGGNTAKENCAVYSLTPFVFIKIVEALNFYAVAITAVATIFIAGFTYTLRQATIALRDSTDKLWKAGERQLGISQRPWIGNPEIFPHGKIALTQTGELTFSLKFKAENVGHSPALLIIDIRPWLFLKNEDEPWVAALEEECSKRRNEIAADESKAWGLGRFSVFPGKTFENIRPYRIEKEKVAAAIERSETDYGTRGITPMVVGCVTYAPIASLEKEIHQTGFVATLYVEDANNPNASDPTIKLPNSDTWEAEFVIRRNYALRRVT